MKRGRPSPASERRTFRAAEAFMQIPQKPCGPIFEDEPARKARAAPVPSDRPLERDVLADVLEAVRGHVKVGWCERVNSGTAVAINPDGSKRYTRFHTIRGMSDLLGQLTDGRILCLEIKRDGATQVPAEQRLFLQKVMRFRGVFGLVWTPEMAIAILDAA